MSKDRRWLKSVLVASSQPLPALPWARGTRRRPAAVQAPVQAPVQTATRRAAG